MPILFSVVSAGKTILADHAICSGNFDEVIQQILPNVSKEDHRHTYTHSDYKFHYISQGSIVFMCITDNQTSQKVAFSYLADIKDKFMTQYDPATIRFLPFSLQADFAVIMKNQMKHHNSLGKVEDVKDQVDELKNIMVQSIDQLMNRGERLELLVNKTQNLSENSITFRKAGLMVKKRQCSKNFKMVIVIVLVSLLMLYIVVTISCGGLAWEACVGGQNNSTTTK